MATMNSNQENLYQEVLKVLQERTNDPSVIMTALGRAMLIILQAAQKFYGDPKGVKETAEKASMTFCESYKHEQQKPVREPQKAPDGLHKSKGNKSIKTKFIL